MSPFLYVLSDFVNTFFIFLIAQLERGIAQVTRSQGDCEIDPTSSSPLVLGNTFHTLGNAKGETRLFVLERDQQKRSDA
jgi:hypothetical protein